MAQVGAIAIAAGRADVQSALRGVNAVAVGLLLAALCTPVTTSGIKSPVDFAVGIVAFLMLVFWLAPPWLVVGRRTEYRAARGERRVRLADHYRAG